MPTALARTTVLEKATKAPRPGSLLISAGSDSAECGLCGNAFDGEASKSTRIEFPCDDSQCEPCGGMWRILSSPTCLACYGGFTCPRLARDQADAFSPQPGVDANDTLERQSPPESQIESPFSFEDRYMTPHSTDTNLDDEMIPDPGSPMRGEDDKVTAVSELSDKDLQEALTLANNRVNTNFNIQEIAAEIPLTDWRTCTMLQLAGKLTQFCISKASDSDDDEEMKEDEAEDESSQQPEGNDLDNTKPWCLQQPGETAETDPRRCIHCGRMFRTINHLRQHMVVHSISHRTCSICGKVLGTSSSRRVHESKHRETESERDERLRKARISKQRVRAGQKVVERERRQRLPQMLG